MRYSYFAAVDHSTLYVRLSNQNLIFSYTISTSSWSRLPDSHTCSCPSVIINNLLTLVGGHCSGTFTLTNQLFSLTVEGRGRRWTEEFPPMNTERWNSTALCTGAALVVAGGDGHSRLQAVEVLNTETRHWSSAADLPTPLSHVPAAVCGDQIYILGSRKAMHTCSVQPFLASIRNRVSRVWKEVAAPPVTSTTSVSIHG